LDKDEAQYLNKLWERMANAEEDKVYWKMKFHGEWPTDEAHITELFEDVASEDETASCELPERVRLKDGKIYAQITNDEEEITLNDLYDYAARAIYWGHAMRKMAGRVTSE
jgi:hypothetical protein